MDELAMFAVLHTGMVMTAALTRGDSRRLSLINPSELSRTVPRLQYELKDVTCEYLC